MKHQRQVQVLANRTTSATLPVVYTLSGKPQLPPPRNCIATYAECCDHIHLEVEAGFLEGGPRVHSAPSAKTMQIHRTKWNRRIASAQVHCSAKLKSLLNLFCDYYYCDTR